MTAVAAASPDAPARRRSDGFRPDIQGLRALAVLLVLFYHFHFFAVRGGYIGVDVFFVVSGYLITALLLREVTERGRVSLAGFYARRARRILPAATLVLAVTLVASYHWLGFIRGADVAHDTSWASGFLANVHFALQKTSYLQAQVPPSPLQHFWSLAVEEQFYLVWPAVFLLCATVAVRRVSYRTTVTLCLVAVTVASIAWCIAETRSDPVWAYFSPLTRAFELSAGAGLAVVAGGVARVPRIAGATAGWVGLFLVIASSLILSSSTRYPGVAVLLPVVATILLLGGGLSSRGLGPDALLGRAPIVAVGAISYSLYLWHWPLLVIAQQHAGHSLTLLARLILFIAAFALAIATYRLVENPLRYSAVLRRRPGLSIAFGIMLVALVLGLSALELALHPAVTRVSPVEQ